MSPIEKCRRINKLLAMKCRGIVAVKERVRCVTNFWFWRLGALWGLCLQTKYWLKSFVIPCMEYHKDYKMLLITLDAINLAREYSQLSWSTVKYWQNNFSERANLPRIYLLLKDYEFFKLHFPKKRVTRSPVLWLLLQSPLADIALFSSYKSKRNISPLVQLLCHPL